MEYEQIKTMIKEILCKKVLRISIPEISDDCLLGEGGLGLDSLNFLKLLAEIEKELNISIEDEYWDYNKMNTVNKISMNISAYML
ncbi:MAG TPA: phosphopantetheine-binding protein [Mobilitalea sp.]|nr:phosphopantetheine-binding protein [Mobilitalea sp.]